MNDKMKTLTVVELATILLQHCKQDKKVANYKVFLSTDPEGNGYSTLNSEWSFQFGADDKIMTLMPYAEGLQDEDIAPKENKRIMAEIAAENKKDAQTEARAS